MGGLAEPLAFPLGGSGTGVCDLNAQEREIKQLLISLLPPGRLYDLSDGTNAEAIFCTLAKAFTKYGFAKVDELRREINPSTAVSLIPDWEAALGLSLTSAALYGSIDQRRAQVIAKLRESGSYSRPEVRAIVGVLLGYADPTQLVINECDRAALRTAHTYTSAGGALGAHGTLTQTFSVLDDPRVSVAGAVQNIIITHTTPGDLSFTLTGPPAAGGNPQASISWPAGTLPSTALVASAQRLFATAAAGCSILGTWTLVITNNGGNAATIGTCGLFVEGCGLDAHGNNGLGGIVYEWSVLYDPDLGSVTVPADFVAALRTLRRIKPAHTNVYLTKKATTGSSFAIYDDLNSTYDGCIYAA